jgi:hypothetical protein
MRHRLLEIWILGLGPEATLEALVTVGRPSAWLKDCLHHGIWALVF